MAEAGSVNVSGEEQAYFAGRRDEAAGVPEPTLGAMTAAAKNTDRELFREDNSDPAGMYYEPFVFVTEDQRIGMAAGGVAHVMSIRDWIHSSECRGLLDRLYIPEAVRAQGMNVIFEWVDDRLDKQ